MKTDHDVPGLPGTEPLTQEGDIPSQLVDAADRFLLRKLKESVINRPSHWSRDSSSHKAYACSVAPNRARLAHILGVREERAPLSSLELIGNTDQPAKVGQGDGYEIHSVRWPAFADVCGEGLLLQPTGQQPVANIVAVPDADLLPEQIAGLVEGVAPESQYARRLAESGCRVVVPTLIDRAEKENRITNREFIYRAAYELGRHLIGYEITKIQAVIDWFDQDAAGNPIGVIGWGEGGLLAFYTAALDERVSAACVSGYFQSRQEIWREPMERNVFGLLEQFGDAEIAELIAPRTLIVEAATCPEFEVRPGTGGAAPGKLTTPVASEVEKELERARSLVKGLDPEPRFDFVGVMREGQFGSDRALNLLLEALAPDAALVTAGQQPKHLSSDFDPSERQARQVYALDRHNQRLLHDCAKTRDEFFSNLDCSSFETLVETIKPYREYFANEVVGSFDDKMLPFNARSRLAYDETGWKGYEVVLDVFQDLFAYGVLLLPDDLAQGEQRPVVVCQHGLEGRVQDIIEGGHEAYHDFAAHLCKRGFIVFAPQNLYLFQDRFRALQRKANPLKKTLFSMIVPQHQQITDWLKTLPYVNPERIGFYGISYGGKTAMRVPPLVSNYCLSICSADFNEWVWKNTASDSAYSYLPSEEYEIFEFDLGSTFNYAEMSRLICPRPFMVERGHYDLVAPDETVAYEYAKTQRHYDLLGLGDQTEMEVFEGGHEIHEVGTYTFLHKHLKWPVR